MVLRVDPVMMSMICRWGVVGLLAMAACGTGEGSIDGEVAGGSVRVEFVGAIDANLDAEHHRPTDLEIVRNAGFTVYYDKAKREYLEIIAGYGMEDHRIIPVEL